MGGRESPVLPIGEPMRSILGILLLPFLEAFAVFAMQNVQTVRFRFVNWALNAPLDLTVVAVYLLGMVTGWTVVAFVRTSYRRVMAPPSE
jgi:lipopolysaccharide assembly protein A